MEFIVNKYRVMHIWKRYLEFQYQMNNGWDKPVDEERDLGVLMLEILIMSTGKK